jgi:cytoskeleton protein RodZ
MTENNEQPEQTAHEPEQALPGKSLREAREARGLSREEVAAQLRLQLKHITALEEDDYGALPGQTFVTGYLRNYARLLELPEDSFVSSVVSRSAPPPLVATNASRKQASSRDWLTRLATLVILGVTVLSVVLWWMQREAVEQTVAPAATTAGAGTEQTLALPEAEPPAPELSAEAAPAEAPAETSVEEPVSRPASEPTAGGQAQAGQAQAGQVAASGPASETEPAPLTEAMPQSKLELHFEADSWTEIEDSAGRRLSYGLIEAGKVLVLRGEAPFSVFLGYAPGVKVYYNGDLFDHSPFQRRDVARFRIGRAEHNHPGSR